MSYFRSFTTATWRIATVPPPSTSRIRIGRSHSNFFSRAFFRSSKASPQGIQSATKTFVSPGFALWRFEQKASRRPSGENIGKPSNVGL